MRLVPPASYRATLDRAGVHELAVRNTYRDIAREVRRLEPPYYAATRLLAPARLQPHILCLYAFAHATDTAADSGPAAGRPHRFRAWETAVRAALADRRADDPRLAALLHTLDRTGLPDTWVGTFMDGMAGDLGYRDFGSEGGFQAYVDRVSHPLMLLLSGVHPGCRTHEVVRALRDAAEAAQRIDCLSDLADDVRAGLPCLPHTGRQLRGQIELADVALGRARAVLPLLPAEFVPVMTAFLDVHRIQLRAVERAAPRLTRNTVRTPLMPSLRVLLAARRQHMEGALS
ncbi:phytoene/squalene synthase family protein [Streptomyces sp. NPDC015345]|uniref:phytoene/squalene synthase family protein n=1 Tax=Streptomyces sp. NPDC015345 TaxID=3364953 RepID=UPI0036F6BD0F